jgi:hypothetical protein
MPCLTQTNLTPAKKLAQRDALARLEKAIAAGTVRVVIGRTGGIAFAGWADSDRNGVSDLCAYRALSNSPELRRAVTRAEALAGRQLDKRAISSGMHSHDGGHTWGTHSH